MSSSLESPRPFTPQPHTFEHDPVFEEESPLVPEAPHVRIHRLEDEYRRTWPGPHAPPAYTLMHPKAARVIRHNHSRSHSHSHSHSHNASPPLTPPITITNIPQGRSDSSSPVSPVHPPAPKPRTSASATLPPPPPTLLRVVPRNTSPSGDNAALNNPRLAPRRLFHNLIEE